MDLRLSPLVYPNACRMAKILPPTTVAHIRYRVLRLDGDYGPRYLRRSQAGDLVGLDPYGAEPMRLYAACSSRHAGTLSLASIS
jgi:hypothetical protein